VRLPDNEAQRRLAGARVAVLAVNDATGSPLAVPITFALAGFDGVTALVTAVDGKPKQTRRLRRLRLVQLDPRVAVLAHGYDEDWRRLWWVRMDGRAEVLPGGAASAVRERALSALAARYPQYRRDQDGVEPDGGALLRPDADLLLVRPERWTGWSGESEPEP
jgi:PPOX class probable F420-dependent enzyme